MRNSGLLFFLLLVCAEAIAQQPTAATDLRAQAKAALSITSGTLKVSGLQRSVTVLRDRWGVAHIYADNQHDLFFAQGYVAGQDRLFQMELWKRVGQGRLAEILGPAYLERDVNARLLRYRGDMRAEYASYGPDTQEILKAFTDGINAFIAHCRSAGWPIEFRLAGFEPEEWKPEDCLMRMAGFPMTGNAYSELYHAALVSQLGAERAAGLLDLDPKVPLDPAPGVDYSGLAPDLLEDLVGSDTRIVFPREGAPADMVPLEPDDQGSNDWTVAGKLTESGKPLLANDPHRTMAEPSLRYMIHLSAPGPHGTWDVVGAGEPGLPGVAVGHNQHIAWGFTIFPIDQQDLYIEQLNPVDPTEYRGPNGWERMRVEREQFRVKDRQPVDRELRFTRHGPVLWADAKRALVLHWVGTEPGTAGYLGSLAVDRAQNWEQFLGAMQRWKVPPENIVYADTSGNIGEQSAGLAPRRSWTGLLPVADDGKHEWQGFIPLDQLPRVFNPPGGFYATANHKVTSPGYPFNIGFEWSMPFRINRINELLGNAAHSGHQLGIANMQSMQTDVTSLAAKQLFEILRSAAASSSDAKVKLLLAWDGVLRRDSAVAALYEFWVRGLRQQLTRRVVLPNDPHSQQLIALIEPRLPLTVMIGWLQHPTAALFGSSPSAARDQLLVAAIGTAARDLAQLQGNDESKWSWGKLHAITFRHPLENVTSGTPTFLDLGPVERPGDGTTVNATAFSGSFAQTSGASYREIFDLSDWDNSVAVNTPGQSGQPASPHYSDLLQLWDQGQYFPLVYSRQAVEKNATEKLILQP